ncbi:hypothetical protein CC80DRAFT_507286 [Byssothecium circinans]|uniref:RTA1 domain protein n=1 Tax=Byssothecium circinans TaxID=147558 RepID=A0A6A5TM08_9PLEO|nr:hypothetical protein CC80DRAFT_507286 [Byssothecium circinans]
MGFKIPDGKPVQGSVYFYAPSKIAPAIFAFLFFASGAFHVYQCKRYKAWKITGLHPVCCLLFTIGFALRTYGAYNFDQLTIYIISTICIYCAPPILELANYHVLGRILYYLPYFSPLHPGRTLTTFGTLSGVVEILNALGVSYLANPNIPQSRQDLGHILMKTALIAQLAILSVFNVIVVIVHQRCNKAGFKNRKVQGPFVTMYISTALILARTVYRIIEHFGISRAPAKPGLDWDPMSLSPLVRYEWFFYVFEAALMYWNSVLWNTRHPRKYLPEDYHVYLAQDGMTEVMGPGWKDDQNWIMSFLDPCGLLGRKKGGNEQPFWETNGFSDRVPLVKGRNRQSVDEEV